MMKKRTRIESNIPAPRRQTQILLWLSERRKVKTSRNLTNQKQVNNFKKIVTIIKVYGHAMHFYIINKTFKHLRIFPFHSDQSVW